MYDAILIKDFQTSSNKDARFIYVFFYTTINSGRKRFNIIRRKYDEDNFLSIKAKYKEENESMTE